MVTVGSCATCSRYIEHVGGGRWVAGDDHEHIPPGVAVAEVTERILFVGGPVHGELHAVTAGSDHVAAIDTVRAGEPFPDDVEFTQMMYRRTTMMLEVDDRRYARPVFIDTRLWDGSGDRVPADVLQRMYDAVVRQWMRGGRDVTWPPSSEQISAEVAAGRARGGLSCCGSTRMLHRWFCMTSPKRLREPAPFPGRLDSLAIVPEA